MEDRVVKRRKKTFDEFDIEGGSAGRGRGVVQAAGWPRLSARRGLLSLTLDACAAGLKDSRISEAANLPIPTPAAGTTHRLSPAAFASLPC